MLDDNTRRYPRTLQEAFGPYTSNKIDEPRKRRIPLVAKLLAVVYVIAVIVVAFALHRGTI